MLTHLKSYIQFCTYFHLHPFPVVDSVLVVYIQVLCNSMKSVATVKNYILGLQTISRIKGFPFPNISDFQFHTLFKGATRCLLHTPSRAQPITPTILQKIHSILNHSNPQHVSAWAAMLVGFNIFARLSNLLPKNPSSYDHTIHLSRSDILVAQDGILVKLKWSKTIQFRERVHIIPVTHLPNSVLCPKSAVLHMVSLSPANSSAPAFCYNMGSVQYFLCQSEFIQLLRNCLQLLGYEPTLFSGHSFRRGGATSAFSAGVASELVKAHGDWRSDSYLSYLEFSISDRLKVSEAISSTL